MKNNMSIDKMFGSKFDKDLEDLERQMESDQNRMNKNLFNAQIDDEKRKEWKKLYVVNENVYDSRNDCVDLFCYAVTFDLDEALNALAKTQQSSSVKSINAAINVHYVPPTFSFESTDLTENIKEWYRMGIPKFEDSNVSYNVHPDAVFIFSTFSDTDKNQQIDFVINGDTEAYDDPRYWWNYSEESYGRSVLCHKDKNGK